MDNPAPMNFDDWINEIFNHPTGESPWYYDSNTDNYDLWNLEFHYPEMTIQYLTKLFEEIAVLPRQFSDAQIAAGLYYIISPGFSGILCDVFDLSNPADMPSRLRCIEAIYTVYEQLFAVRCSPELFLSQKIKLSRNPLDLICFMWWDMCCYPRSPTDKDFTANDERLHEAIFMVMNKTLTLESEACQEGALHGFNEFHFRYPYRVNALVKTFIAENPQISPQLRKYAEGASWGAFQ
jgi:hypothetical protein